MDSSSRRVAALQKEADELITQAAKLRKEDPRLNEIASRLQGIESEYSALLSAKPHAVAGHDELTALRSDNCELRRRNLELEKQIATLLRWQQDSQKELSKLDSELRKWQESLNVKAGKLEPRLAAAEAFISSAMKSSQSFDSASQQLQETGGRVDEVEAATARGDGIALISSAMNSSIGSISIDKQWFDSASQQLKEMGGRVDEVEAATARGDGMDHRLTVAEADVKKASDLVGTRITDLERELESMRNQTPSVKGRIPSEDWNIELRAISDQAGEAKHLICTAKAEVEGQSQSALRVWASSELGRLKKQLAAATT